MVSIVAVHGINGGSWKTWESKKVMWLKDLLPAKIPEARIMTFGYDAMFISAQDSATIEQHAMTVLGGLADIRTSDEVRRPSTNCECSSGL
jgi:hypothetical protein